MPESTLVRDLGFGLWLLGKKASPGPGKNSLLILKSIKIYTVVEEQSFDDYSY